VPAGSIMRWLLVGIICAGGSTAASDLIILALLEQFQLSAQNQNLFLLGRHGTAERFQGIFEKGQLALHLVQLLHQGLVIAHSFAPCHSRCAPGDANILPTNPNGTPR